MFGKLCSFLILYFYKKQTFPGLLCKSQTTKEQNIKVKVILFINIFRKQGNIKLNQNEQLVQYKYVWSLKNGMAEHVVVLERKNGTWESLMRNIVK